MADQAESKELKNIANALDKILSHLHRQPSPPGRAMTIDALIDLRGETHHSGVASDLIRDPIGYSLRLGIEALGERLNEIGGQPAMLSVLEEVAARDPGNEEWRTNIMDKRFDGIGTWMA